MADNCFTCLLPRLRKTSLRLKARGFNHPRKGH